MSTQSKKHHYVPRSLLKAFSINDAETHLYVFDKKASRVYKSSVVDAGSENHFNTLQWEGKTFSFEGAFASADNTLAEILATLRSYGELSLLTGPDRLHLAQLAAIQFYRTKQMRENYKHMNRLLMDAVKRFAPDAPDSAVPELDENQLKALALQMRKGVQESLPFIRGKHMILYRTTLANPFWISDNPLVVANSNPWGDIGIASPGVEICWPISSTLLLSFLCPTVLIKLERINGTNAALLRSEPTVVCSPASLTYYNSLQGYNSTRFLYACSPDFALMKEMMSRQPELSKDRARLTTMGAGAGPSHPHMPNGKWLVLVGQRTYYMIPLTDWSSEGVYHPRMVNVATDGVSELEDALEDAPYSEGGIYQDRQQRVGFREVVLERSPTDPLVLTIRHVDPVIRRILEGER